MVERSLILMLNNKGPKIDPCGTPVLIYLNPDSLTLYLTYCFLFDIKLFSNFSAVLVIP